MNEHNQAIVIYIITGRGEDVKWRYFNSFTKSGVCSVWHLSGARLFKNESCKKLEKVKKRLEAEKSKFELTIIDNFPF